MGYERFKSLTQDQQLTVANRRIHRNRKWQASTNVTAPWTIRRLRSEARNRKSASAVPSEPAFNLSPSCGVSPKASPIEQMLLYEVQMQSINAKENFVLNMNGEEFLRFTICQAKREVAVVSQFPIGKYFVDMLVTMKTIDGSASATVVVECDGHEFHEKTKRQVEKDKARERVIVTAGYRVLRYSGSEIHRDAERCASELRKSIRSLMEAK